MTAEKYTGAAAAWTNEQYADPVAYLRRRAELIATLGTPLAAGDVVLDLACGDGGLGDFLLDLGLGYAGVDLNAEMVAAARRRLDGRATVAHGDLNEFEPDAPVAAATLFRALYYAHDRVDFFARVARYAERKLVFDVNPRQYRLADVLGDLRKAGWPQAAARPFFVPQRVALPAPAAALARAAERSGPVARLVLRLRFTVVVAAYR